MRLIIRGKTWCLLLVVLSLIGCSEKQQAKPKQGATAPDDTKRLFLWEISSPTNTIHLLGYNVEKGINKHFLTRAN